MTDQTPVPELPGPDITVGAAGGPPWRRLIPPFMRRQPALWAAAGAFVIALAAVVVVFVWLHAVASQGSVGAPKTGGASGGSSSSTPNGTGSGSGSTTTPSGGGRGHHGSTTTPPSTRATIPPVTTASTSKPTTTVVPHLSVQTWAFGVALQPKDLGSSWSQYTFRGLPVVSGSGSSQCKAFSRPAPTATAYSYDFTQAPTASYGQFGLFPVAMSMVVVEGSPGSAAQAAAVYSGASYTTDCVEPEYDGGQRFVADNADTNRTGPCRNLSFKSSTIADIPSGSLAAGMTGTAYRVTMSCGGTTQIESGYMDTITKVVGRVVVQGVFMGGLGHGQLSQPLEVHLVALMGARATSHIPSSP